MQNDWTMAKAFAVIYGSLVAVCAVPLIWGVWAPFGGAVVAFTLAMVVSVSLTIFDG